MLFFMLQKYRNICKAVINDMNENLITAYKTVRDTPEKLVMRLAEIQREYLSLQSDGRPASYSLTGHAIF